MYTCKETGVKTTFFKVSFVGMNKKAYLCIAFFKALDEFRFACDGELSSILIFKNLI